MLFKFRAVLLAAFLAITIGFQISPAYATDKSHAENSAASLQQRLCKQKAHCLNPTQIWPVCTGMGAGKYSCVGKFSYNTTSNQCWIDQVNVDIAANSSASNAGGSSSPCISPHITADLGSTKNTIPADFVGVSLCTEDLVYGQLSGNPYLTSTNTSLISLLKLLGGSGYLHFTGEQSIPAPPLTLALAQQLGGFVSALGSGWKVSYGLDARVDNPATAVNQAGLILAGVTGNPVDFSIGNEPNDWKKPGPTADQWAGIFDAYYTALKSSHPNINIVSPELGGYTDAQFNEYINSTHARLPPLALGTVHYYPWPPGTLTLPKALSGVNNLSWSGWSDKMRITESSLTWGGGGVALAHASDRQYTTGLVSATWFMEMSIKAATANPPWRGVGQFGFYTAKAASDGGYNHLSYNNCLQQSGPTPFVHIPGGQTVPQPTGPDWSPAPCFYGWYLMSMMEGQPRVANTPSGIASDVYVLTTKNSSGNANILIVNGNANPTSITPDQSSTWTDALVYQLDGTSCTDQAPTLNGYPIGNGGSWGGNPKIIHRGDPPLAISGCGAAVVQIQGSGSPPPPSGWCTAWYDTAKGSWLGAGSYFGTTDTCGMGWNCDCPGAVQSPGNTCGSYADGGHSVWWPTNTHTATSCNNVNGGLDNIYCHGRPWNAAQDPSPGVCAPPGSHGINNY